MQEHERWLAIVQIDLRSAKVLVKEGLFTTVVYHCQQAAEKSLKGYLAFQKQDIIKSHDLVKLVGLCVKFEKDFGKLREATEQLNSYSSQFRYPTEFETPEFVDAEMAIKHAQSIMNFVAKKIAEPVTGQAGIFKSE